ncbi:molybdopterin-binding protein [Anaeroselena agilis]|uniref:Molybdopterin-binding protein n=1 Tax=Anaeroselena agilis TaxID=3063788 RepID=A0ABU3P2T4_9FIRM|nr:molybdopterin-binding protein [Selenomonadales bacterium 4137-cl]
MQLNLLEKTELKIYGLELKAANLTVVAAAVAKVLAIPSGKVLVVDVRDDHICLDLLAKTIDIRQIAGKEKAILAAVGKVNGVEITPGAYVDSAGILGLIGGSEEEAAGIVARAEAMGSEIERAVLGRAIIFATGFEVAKGMIEDTNSPYLIGVLVEQGYRAEFGGILEDNAEIIAHRLRDAADRGFGLVITTGGVGAEDKDFSIEALTKVDPAAVTPWIVKFQAGTGRHVKDGVRIGVGGCGPTTFVSLPGPNDEVVVAGAALRRHCMAGPVDRQSLAADIAAILREKLRHKKWHH